MDISGLKVTFTGYKTLFIFVMNYILNQTELQDIDCFTRNIAIYGHTGKKCKTTV
jgi:hypothetical protein